MEGGEVLDRVEDSDEGRKLEIDGVIWLDLDRELFGGSLAARARRWGSPVNGEGVADCQGGGHGGGDERLFVGVSRRRSSTNEMRLWPR